MTTERTDNLKDAAARMHRCASDALRQTVRLPGRDARRLDLHGFSLLELLVVVAVIAVLAAVLVMPALGAKMRGNETSAIAALRTIATQQECFRAQGVVDQDANGVGEFGLLSELAGAVVPRRTGSVEPLSPRMIDSTFHTDANGFAARYGFYYQVYLATDGLGGTANDAILGGTADAPGPVLADPAAVARQEYYWCAYAWPADRHTGARAFFVDHQGVIYQTFGDAVKYNGTAVTPAADAAYTAEIFTSHPSSGLGKAGNDGNVWTVVQ
jgi:prepilin-type N-terminal cleavage/methylation domain-containing protein